MNNMNYTYLGTRYHKVHVFKSNVYQKKKKTRFTSHEWVSFGSSIKKDAFRVVSLQI